MAQVLLLEQASSCLGFLIVEPFLLWPKTPGHPAEGYVPAHSICKGDHAVAVAALQCILDAKIDPQYGTLEMLR